MVNFELVPIILEKIPSLNDTDVVLRPIEVGPGEIIVDAEGNWTEISKARFSADNTARKEAREDYSGGINNKGFFLMNCGFTNDHTTIGEMLSRPKGNTPPNINFNSLN